MFAMTMAVSKERQVPMSRAGKKTSTGLPPLSRTRSLPLLLREKEAGKPLFWFRPRGIRDKSSTGASVIARPVESVYGHSSAAPAASDKKVVMAAKKHLGTIIQSCPSSTDSEDDVSVSSIDTVNDESLFGLSIIETRNKNEQA